MLYDASKNIRGYARRCLVMRDVQSMRRSARDLSRPPQHMTCCTTTTRVRNSAFSMPLRHLLESSYSSCNDRPRTPRSVVEKHVIAIHRNLLPAAPGYGVRSRSPRGWVVLPSLDPARDLLRFRLRGLLGEGAFR